MTRACGWSPRGKRRTAHVPHGHWKTLTFLAGLRHDRSVAPFVLDGPINGDAFTAWVGQCLAPTLAADDIVIADNLGSHKGPAARQLIRNAGAHLLFLPPCSPDLNPMEMVFAKLKTIRRENDSLDRFLILLIPQSRRTHYRNLMAKGRNLARRLHPKRMPQLHSPRRVRFNVSQTGSRGRPSKTAQSVTTALAQAITPSLGTATGQR